MKISEFKVQDSAGYFVSGAGSGLRVWVQGLSFRVCLGVRACRCGSRRLTGPFTLSSNHTKVGAPDATVAATLATTRSAHVARAPYKHGDVGGGHVVSSRVRSVHRSCPSCDGMRQGSVLRWRPEFPQHRQHCISAGLNGMLGEGSGSGVHESLGDLLGQQLGRRLGRRLGQSLG